MNRADIEEYCHYKPNPQTVVCGFIMRMIEAQEVPEVAPAGAGPGVRWPPVLPVEARPAGTTRDAG
jgi:hypothetical protein